MKPYGIISDTHNHAWSAFASTNERGINTRLQMTLDETRRAGEAVLAAGGDTLFHGGDLFHVRGSIAPSVLNPTKDLYKELIGKGLNIVLLTGNHDLEGRDTSRIGSAVTALEDVGCKVVSTVEDGKRVSESVALIPWIQDVEKLKETIQKVYDDAGPIGPLDLIIHAPVDGVIPGLPDHGLSYAWLGKVGFRRVFSGHYHHFKDFGNGVYSIGALTHQNWGDIGSKAGFLIVSDDGVKWHSTRAPAFVQIDASTNTEEIPLIVDGNYVRAKLNTGKQHEIEAMRQHLLDCGALGVVILSQKEAPSAGTRTGAAAATVKAGASIEASVADFVKAGAFAKPEALITEAMSVLAEARLETAE